jgi:hypothetical protein
MDLSLLARDCRPVSDELTEASLFDIEYRSSEKQISPASEVPEYDVLLERGVIGSEDEGIDEDIEGV